MINDNVLRKVFHFSFIRYHLARSAQLGESKLGRLVDALALGGDEGRDKLR